MIAVTKRLLVYYEQMTFLLSFIIIVVSALSLSYLWQKRFEFTLPLVFSALSLLLYLFAIIDQRRVGVFIVVALCVLGIGLSLLKIRKTHIVKLKDLFSPGFMYVVLSMAVVFLISRNFVLNDWDEFAQWGLVLKNMFYNNGLAVAQGTTAFHQSYPEGISLIQSFFNQFSPIFSEPNTLRSLLFLSFAQLGIAYAGIKNVGIKKGLMIGLALTVLPYVFFANFHGTIYIDAVVGLLVGNILFFDYVYPKKDAFYALYMGLQLSLLASSKQIGIILAAALGIIAILRWVSVRWDKQFLENLRNKYKSELICVLLPMVIMTITVFSWSMYVSAHHLKDIIEVRGMSVKNVYDVFIGSGAPEYRYVTYNNFVRTFFEGRNFGAFSLSYFTLTVVLFVITYLVYNEKKTHQNWLASALIGVLYLYSVVLLFLYLFAFIPYEAQMVASMGRYMGTALLGVTMFLLMVVYSKYSRKQVANNLRVTVPIIATIIILMAANMSSFLQATVFTHRNNIQNIVSRSRYDSVKSYLPILKVDVDKIYIIAQKSDGNAYWKLRYNLTPVHTSPDRTWSIGSGPLYEGDIWSQAKTKVAWSEELNNYTYVYIDAVDETFIKNFGSLFQDQSQIKNTSLYKVNKTNGTVELSLVSPVDVTK